VTLAEAQVVPLKLAAFALKIAACPKSNMSDVAARSGWTFAKGEE